MWHKNKATVYVFSKGVSMTPLKWIESLIAVVIYYTSQKAAPNTGSRMLWVAMIFSNKQWNRECYEWLWYFLTSNETENVMSGYDIF
jgi:hypothetical protein